MSETKQTVVPPWLVSARNGTKVATDQYRSAWWPFGVQHARRVGSRVTACGVAALEWPIFWALPFPADTEASCRDCRAVVELSEASPAEPRDIR